MRETPHKIRESPPIIRKNLHIIRGNPHSPSMSQDYKVRQPYSIIIICCVSSLFQHQRTNKYTLMFKYVVCFCNYERMINPILSTCAKLDKNRHCPGLIYFHCLDLEVEEEQRGARASCLKI